MGGQDLSEVVNTSTATNFQQSTSATPADAERRSLIDSDAELARALAQQDSPTIRAPIAPKREILVGGDQNDHVGLDGGMSKDLSRFLLILHVFLKSFFLFIILYFDITCNLFHVAL